MTLAIGYFESGIDLIYSMHVVHAAWKRRMLQAHFLWHRVPPLHGDHPQPGLCKQVCLLLEVRTCIQLLLHSTAAITE